MAETFLQVGPAPAGVKGLCFCLFYLKRLSYWLNQTPPGPQPLFLVKNLSNSKRVFIKKPNGHDGQRAPLDHQQQQQLLLTLNSLFVPTQNSLLERNRTEWQFWTELIITPSAVVGCRHSLTESRRPDSLSLSLFVCLCGWLSQPRFRRVLMPIPHGRSESLWSQRLPPQKEVDRKCWNHPLS